VVDGTTRVFTNNTQILNTKSTEFDEEFRQGAKVSARLLSLEYHSVIWQEYPSYFIHHILI